MMDATWSLLVLMVVLFILIFLKVQIVWSMLIAGLVAFAAYGIFNKGVQLAAIQPWSVANNESFVCLPLYIIMGEMLIASGLMMKLFDLIISFTTKIRIKGGLGIAVVLANAFFAAMSGAVVAAISTFTPIVMPIAEKYKFNKNLLGAVLAMTGSLASIVPPSLTMIVYGYMTGESIAKLFMAGLIPGILLVFIYSIQIYIQITLNPALAPKIAISEKNWREIVKMTFNNSYTFAIILIVLGGIYLGWFTTTESAAIGAVLAIIVALVLHKLKGRDFISGLRSAGKTLGMILITMVGAALMNYFVAISQITVTAGQFIADIGINQTIFVIALFIFYFLLGMPVDGLPLMIITLPVIYPLVENMGLSPYWFAVFINIVMAIGVVSPPIAINVFFVEAIAKDREVNQSGIYRMVWPFMLSSTILIVLITIFPQLCDWLPSTMK